MKPLAHLTVLDLTVNMPGPFCSMILADLGARVIKLEPPEGDPLRHTPGMFAAVNRGKESLALDLKASGARAFLGRLAAACDVVLEGWRPGVAARLGADYAALSRYNPRLIYCSISAFGQTGPWRDRPAHDVNILALTGYLAAQAQVEGRPWPPAVLISDLSAGLYAAIAVLAAAAARSVSGAGTHIDLAMADAAAALLGPELSRLSAAGAESGAQPNVTSLPHYGVFRCADGRWLSLGIVHEDHFWQRFCRAAGLEDLGGLTFSERAAQAGRIREILDAAFLRRPAGEWERLLTAADVPAAAVQSLSDVPASAQFEWRGLFSRIGGALYTAQPVRFSSGPVSPSAAPPALGQHTEAILAEFATGTDADPSLLETLRASGAVAARRHPS
jgi:crotonobetainyl-CoA:carnitine CoA-transferase CaiB-like acyl-CoA transferase